MMNRNPISIGIAATIFLLACSADEPAREAGEHERSDTLLVYTVNYPLAYFAQRIGGEGVRAIFPAPPGIDPADWAPAPEEVAAFQQADLIALNGPDHTAWTQRATFSKHKLIDTSASFRDRLIDRDGEVEHTHGPSGAHVHAGTYGTTWLDPLLAIEQARAIADALISIRPENSADFESRFAALEVDLLDLDARFSEAARSTGGAPLLFSHPVYPYFERRYSVNAQSLHWEPDEAPTARMWQELNEILAKHPARRIIWEGSPLEETRQSLESLGVSSIVFAPCANTPATGDWFSAMRDAATQLKESGDQLSSGG